MAMPEPAPAPVYQAPAPTPPQYQTPPPQPQPQPQPAYQQPYAPQQPYAAPYPPAEPVAASGPNPILVAIAVTVGLLGLGYVAYNYLLPSSKATQEAAADKPLITESAGGKPNPLAKHIEVSGFRIREDKAQKVTVQMVVINHGAADIAGLELQVGLYAKGNLVVEFPVKVKNLGPYEVAQGTGSATTKLRAYEIPDWQFLTPKVTIIAPAP